MRSFFEFDSSWYRAIQWKDIFYKTACALSKNGSPLGIVNRNGIVMLSANMLDFQRINLCFRDEIAHLVSDDLVPILHNLVTNDGILFFKIKCYTEPQHPISEEYLQFCQTIVANTFEASTLILRYTLEHLSQRFYGNKAVSSLEVIQDHIAEIRMLQENIALLHCQNLEEIVLRINLMSVYLTHIAKISGARAVLKNNVLNLLFYLKYFQKYIE